ncbi:hypothetical protein GGR52DRAFT_283787 [Hypoxylon sp. FL1284]|nr:hypothetical protein GGR52DRAFT_283787 [Hypoxylon sp. FL1284]
MAPVMSTPEKFTLFNRLPPELRIAIWHMAIDDALPVKPALCVYWLPTFAAEYHCVKEIAWNIPGVMHACHESRWETITTKRIIFDQERTGVHLNPRRPFTPGFDFIFISFHVFMSSITRIRSPNQPPTILRRNPKTKHLHGWCVRCYKASTMSCHQCKDIFAVTTRQLISSWAKRNSERDRNDALNWSLELAHKTLETWGEEENPTMGDLGVLVRQSVTPEGISTGPTSLRMVLLGPDTHILDEATEWDAEIGGEDSAWEFSMSKEFDFTIFPRGHWPN